jgi:hypothetical protein
MKELAALSKDLCEEKCNVSKESPNYGVIHVLEKVLAFRMSSSPIQQVQSLLESSITDTNIITNILALIQECITKESQIMIQASLASASTILGNPNSRKRKSNVVTVESDVEANVVEANVEANVEATQRSGPKKKMRVGNETIMGKDDLFRLTGMERLNKIVEISESLGPDIGVYDTSSQNCIKRTVRPVMRCLNSHLSGNSEAFLQFWSNDFPYSRFNYLCNTKKGCKYLKENPVPE